MRLRQANNVQRLVARQFARMDWSRADAQGYQVVEDQLKLEGWSRTRRLVIVRKRNKDGLARERRDERGQLCLALADTSVLDGAKLWEW